MAYGLVTLNHFFSQSVVKEGGHAGVGLEDHDLEREKTVKERDCHIRSELGTEWLTPSLFKPDIDAPTLDVTAVGDEVFVER